MKITLENNIIAVVAEDGRTMFEIRACKDAKSIEVRSGQNCRVRGVLYGTQLLVEPRVSNEVIIRTAEYDA